MIELLIGFFLTAFAYCACLVAGLWSIERFGWLRDGAWSESAWRASLWLGILVALIVPLRVPMSEFVSDFKLSPSRQPPQMAPAMGQHDEDSASIADLIDVRQASPALVNTPAPAKPAPTAIKSEWAQLLAGLLLSALLLAVSLLLWSLWQKHCLLRSARRRSLPASPQWRAYCIEIAPGLAPPSLLSVPGLCSPIAASNALILLPDWCDTLEPQAQRAMLAHELAHIRRRDPFWRLCDAIAVALLAGFPPARYAQWRLRDLSEFSCDAEAARRTGSPRALAECLASCLERMLVEKPLIDKTPALAVAMVTPARGVVARVQRLLEESPMHTKSGSRFSPRWIVTAAALLTLVLPGIAVTVAGDRERSSMSIRQSDGLFGDESISASFSDGKRKLKIEIEGQVQFNDEESAVTSISKGGSFQIVDVHEGIERDLSIVPNGNGLERRYRVDGEDLPYDAAAERWLGALLPELFRRTGIFAESRLKRILARGGVEAALREIALIRADYGRATYIGILFDQAELDSTQLERVIELTASIGSDYEQRRALTPALSSERLSDAAQAKILALVPQLESDYERAELLIAASSKVALNGERLAAWRAATETIGSDYEKRRVLEALLDQKEQTPAHAALAIAMAGTVGSDYERRMLLQAAIEQTPQAAITRSEYVRVASKIGSDYERREALTALLDLGPIDRAAALDIIKAAGEIGSDYEAKELLLAVARAMPRDAEVIEAYRAVARTLSPYERGEAEAGLDRFAQN